MYGPLRKCSSAWRQEIAAHDPTPCHLLELDHVPSVGSLQAAVKHEHGHLRNWEPTWLWWQKKKNGRNLFFWVIFVLVTDQLRKDWSHEASLYLILENKKIEKNGDDNTGPALPLGERAPAGFPAGGQH